MFCRNKQFGCETYNFRFLIDLNSSAGTVSCLDMMMCFPVKLLDDNFLNDMLNFFLWVVHGIHLFEYLLVAIRLGLFGIKIWLV